MLHGAFAACSRKNRTASFPRTLATSCGSIIKPVVPCSTTSLANGTSVTVLLKGTACGALAGLTYQKLASRSRDLAVAAAAVVCPVVNTGVFLLGCLLFFLDTVAAWGQAAGFGSIGAYMLFGLVGGNFLFELGSNIVLSPIVVRLLHIREQSR